MTTTRLGAVCAGILMAIGGVVQAAPISGQGTWETTLQGRDLDGNLATFEAYYDTVLDITWLADANYAYTSGYQTLNNGRMTWANANTWAAGLDINGYTGWRLPTIVDVYNDGVTYANIYQGVDYGYNITTHSEMSHVFYTTLGNLAYYDTSGSGPQAGWGLTNTGPFSNLQSDYYWSATEYVMGPIYAWNFGFYSGLQNVNAKTSFSYAWAVHAGDVGASAVPAPAALLLFGSGLLGLLGTLGVDVKRRL